MTNREIAARLIESCQHVDRYSGDLVTRSHDLERAVTAALDAKDKRIAELEAALRPFVIAYAVPIGHQLGWIMDSDIECARTALDMP